MQPDHQLHTYESSGDPSSGADSSASDDIAIKPRKAARDEAEMDITPMIDITFLLLIFFLVASKMDAAGDVMLPKAEYGTVVAVDESVVITVAEGGADGRARIFKGDTTDTAQQLRSADLADQEEEMVAYLEENLIGKKRYVLIKAARGVKRREVARVEEAASRVEQAQSLYLAVLEEG
jgi:biopolymer transport protein ExbD